MNAATFAALLAVGLLASLTRAATVEGRVLDSQGVPVGGATILVESQNSQIPEQTKTIHSDAKGIYRISSLPGGSYTIQARMTARGQTTSAPFLLSETETKNVDLILKPAASSIDFFDQPKFTVAGVTDHTYVGGHGSDTVKRSAEAITQATASLGKQSSTAESLEALRQASQGAPENAALHHQIATADEKMGNPLEAVQEYQRAAELDATETNLFDWGTELLVHDAPQPALDVFSAGVKLFPLSSRMLIGAGAALYAHGDYGQAAQRFFAATDLNPADPEPYMFLGKLRASQITATQEFADRMARFAELQSQNAWAKYLYATTLWNRRKDPNDAETTAHVESLLTAAIRLDPALAVAYLQLGILSAEKHDFATAIRYYRKAIELDPAMEQAHYRSAEAYRQTGEPEKAREEIAQFQQLSRSSAQQVDHDRSELQRFVVRMKNPGSN